MFVVIDCARDTSPDGVYGPFATVEIAHAWLASFDPRGYRGDWFVREIEPITVAEALPIMAWRANPPIPAPPGPGSVHTCSVEPIVLKDQQ
jgi:hypothetical protein